MRRNSRIYALDWMRMGSLSQCIYATSTRIFMYALVGSSFARCAANIIPPHPRQNSSRMFVRTKPLSAGARIKSPRFRSPKQPR